MQEKLLYEYAVIRIVPRVEREEFLNIGVILYCPQPAWLQARFHINKERLQLFSKDIDIPEIEAYLSSILTICEGKKNKSVLAAQSMAYRFRWITANRSTMIQTSRVHPGFCEDAEKELLKLFEELVL